MKTTKAQFERFKKQCLKLQNLLGLNDIRIDVFHEPIEDAYATAGVNHSLCCSTLTYSTKISAEAAKLGITPEQNASHEMAHVVTGRLYALARSRFASEDEIDIEAERLARLLTPVLHAYGEGLK